MFGDPVTNPMEWDNVALGNVVKVRSSKRVYQREQTTHGVPFLRVSDLVNRIANGLETNELFMSDEQYEDFAASGLVPKSGDILVTSRGTLGLCYIVTDADRFYFQDGMISWLDRQESRINSIYLAFLFQTDMIKQQLEAISTGSTVNYISLGNLEGFNILLPPLPFQNRFADFVRAADKSKFVARKATQTLKALVL